MKFSGMARKLFGCFFSILLIGCICWAASDIVLDTNRPKSERMERQYKFLIPINEVDKAYALIKSTFIDNKDELEKISPDITATSNISDFTDVYFDTPELKFLKMHGLIRHRIRLNLTDPTNRKSGRELVQMKVSDDAAKPTDREEIKFDVSYPKKIKSSDDQNPIIGIIEPAQRDRFKAVITQAGASPYSIIPIFTLHDHRSRIAFQYKNKPDRDIAGISVDRFTVRIWWATIHLSQLEVEVNEVANTTADEQERKKLNLMVDRIVSKVSSLIPALKLEVVPKYNYSFNALNEKMPYLQFLIAHNIHTDESMWTILLVLVISIAAIVYLVLSVFRNKRKKNRLS